MITYVNTVLVSNLAAGAVLTAEPAKATSMNAKSDDAGKFILMNCDPDIEEDNLYVVDNTTQTIKIGIVTKKNTAVRMPDGTTEYRPIIKWSNEIKAADIKSYKTLAYEDDTEDSIEINFDGLDNNTLNKFAEGGKRIIVRLTFKDLPTRYRKWTESYEYITQDGDTKATIATNIANLINKEWKRARVQATADGTKVTLVALPYDDDDAVETLNWANKVRFNANIYYTDPGADGWESLNKHFPTGVIITKTPGKQYPASAKLVRDHESIAMGYQGILNRGCCTWPIIKPDMETDIDAKYDAITLEFENMYRAADDIFRKTKQTVEIYGLEGQLEALKAVLEPFVTGEAAAAAAGDEETGNEGGE